MKEIKRYRFIKTTWDTFYRVTIGYIKEHKLGGYTEYSNYKKVLDENKQLQARIKELESQTHINEIKAQGIEDMLNDDVFKEYVRYSLRGLDSTEMDDYTYLENVRNYAEQLRTKHD